MEYRSIRKPHYRRSACILQLCLYPALFHLGGANCCHHTGLVLARVQGVPGSCRISGHQVLHPRILRFYVLIGTRKLSSIEQMAPAISNSQHKRCFPTTPLDLIVFRWACKDQQSRAEVGKVRTQCSTLRNFGRLFYPW